MPKPSVQHLENPARADDHGLPDPRILASGPPKNQGYNRLRHLTLPSLGKLAEAWA